MTGRVVLGAVLGGFAMFIWGAVAHMALPLGKAGIQWLPEDEKVLAGIGHLATPGGLYFFPGTEHRPEMSATEKEAAETRWDEKYRRLPHGLLLIRPATGQSVAFPKLLCGEVTSNIAACLVAGILLALARLPAFAARLGFVVLIALAAWLSIEVSYWNWYEFPASYTLAQLGEQLGGFFFAGLPLAWLVRPQAA
jgi:hypothetical protein